MKAIIVFTEVSHSLYHPLSWAPTSSLNPITILTSTSVGQFSYRPCEQHPIRKLPR